MALTRDITPRQIEDSVYIEGPFDENLKTLEAEGYRLISLEENARLRMQEGKGAYCSKNGNWVKQGSLYVLGKGRFITNNSPVLDNPTKATQAHRQGEEDYISDEQVEKALADSVQVPFKVSEILTNRFGEDPITVFCFGDSAQDYGLWLKDEAKIRAMPLWFDNEDYINEKGKSFANQLWLYRLDNRSELNGNDRILDYDSRSRGVK